MPPGKPEQTPEQRALRLRAYELYLAVDQDGRRRSLRSIAMELGVTLGTVQYWRKRDKWDARVAKTLQAQTAAAGAGAKAISALLRTTLYEHINTLSQIARDMSLKPADRIKAVGELADITIKLKAIDPADMADANRHVGVPITFKDDLGDSDGNVLPPASAEDHVQLSASAGPDPDHDHDDAAGPSAGGGPAVGDAVESVAGGFGPWVGGDGVGTPSKESDDDIVGRLAGG